MILKSKFLCNKKITYLLFAVVISFLQITAIFAQKRVNTGLLNYAKSTPDSVESSFTELSSYLKSGTQNDKETVETIFYWVAINIAYHDDPRFETGSRDSLAINTLMTKKSGCEGTAWLFYELCKAAQIECEVIFGIAEGSGFDGGRLSRSNHGWNAVKLDDTWELVDATWGGGGSTMVGDSAVYIIELDMRYLFADPKSFVIDHFPEVKKWQLLAKPISKRKFFSEDYELKRWAKHTKYS
jgi:transglutaminase/protease-like cytokinesis protein 3